jgi:hypothetical protein
MCVQKMVDPPKWIIQQREKENKEQTPRKPRGWKLMKVFVDSDGNVFHKGKEQLELKGTLEPTIISSIIKKPKKKLSKREKEEKEHKKNEYFAQIEKIKKEILERNLTTRMRKVREKDIRKIEKKIKKL